MRFLPNLIDLSLVHYALQSKQTYGSKTSKAHDETNEKNFVRGAPTFATPRAPQI